MNDDNELDPVARLRAADPAAGVEPRAGFVDEIVARATAEQATASAPVADLTSERARRRPRWLPIAAVAASIAIVGGAGFGLGASTAGGMNAADGAAPPISLQSGTGTGGMAPGGGAPQDGRARSAPALGGPEAFAGSASKRSAIGANDMMLPWGFGRNSFRSVGLSTAAGTASAYAFDARAGSNADTVAALAAALGVEGAVELKDGSWQAGPADGTAPSLWVSLDGMLSFSFSNPLIDPWQCGTAEVVEPCEPPATLPSADAAIDALRSVIVSTGRDPGAFEFTSETWDGAFTRNAQAWPVVDGQRIDQAWSLEFTDAGVSSVYGALADVVPLSAYPVVSEQEGFERLSDPRFGAQMTALPMALREAPATAYAEWVPPTEPPAAPTAGTPLSWPVNTVEIVSARLGLASQWQPDGSVLIVPAYEFTDAEGGTWSVIAVADSKLDFATD